MFNISKLMATAADEKPHTLADISYVLDTAPSFKKALETCIDAGWDLKIWTNGKGCIVDINLNKGKGPDSLKFVVCVNRTKPFSYSRNDEYGSGAGGPHAPGPSRMYHPIKSLEDAVEPLKDYTFKNMPKFTELLLEEQRQELRSPIVKGLDRLQAALK